MMRHICRGIGSRITQRLIFSSVLVASALAVNIAQGFQEDDEIPYPIKGQITISPEIFDLGIPDGKVLLPNELDRVQTHDTDNKPCVAKIHCRVGKNFIVKLPDGQLVGRMSDEVQATQKPFVPLTHDELAAAIIDEAGLTGFRTESTDNFVLIYNTTTEFAEVTVKVMQTMLEGVIEYTHAQGMDTQKPDVILPVIAFHTAAQFQRFKPIPPGVAAYYEIATNRVVLKEEANVAALGPELVQQELLSTIAHEGCHQLLHNIGVQQRLSRWPMWLGEGIAEYMAPTKPGRRFAWKGAGKINDMRMFELEIFLQKQFVKGFDGDTVDQTVRAARLDSTGYASAWTITHHLAEEQRADFDRYMRYLSRMAPLHGMMPEDQRDPEAVVDENMVHFKAFFGEDIEAFENAMVKNMSAERYTSPVGAFPHFVGTAVVPGEEEDKLHTCFFIDQGNLEEWRREVHESLTEYEREHTKFQLSQHANRGAANSYIKKWKRDMKKESKKRRR